VTRSSSFRAPLLRSQLAQPGDGVPPGMMVVVADEGKLFHRATCPFIHEKRKRRTIPAAEASLEGYTPCMRCLKKYLASA
jgi:methylphosphotriester-DNA--protein-cysteine methyltransferase